MFITIINDCTDSNVIGRQGTRVASLFGITPTYVGVGGKLQFENAADPAEFEAAGCLVDVLDAGGGTKGVVLVNVANRHTKGKKWPNGTPFCYFYAHDTLVVATIDGYVLSLVKKLGITDTVWLLDIPTVVASLAAERVISSELRDYIMHTQFRSLEFAPRVAKWLLEGRHIPSEVYPLTEIADISASVWYVDNFGNCKTTILPEDIGFAPGKEINTQLGVFPCYERLKDVPNDQKALIIGSSGYQEKRLIELVVQGKSAAKIFNLAPGSIIL